MLTGYVSPFRKPYILNEALQVYMVALFHDFDFAFRSGFFPVRWTYCHDTGLHQINIEDAGSLFRDARALRMEKVKVRNGKQETTFLVVYSNTLRGEGTLRRSYHGEALVFRQSAGDSDVTISMSFSEASLAIKAIKRYVLLFVYLAISLTGDVQDDRHASA